VSCLSPFRCKLITELVVGWAIDLGEVNF